MVDPACRPIMHLELQPMHGARHGCKGTGRQGHPAAQVHVALLRARVRGPWEVVQPCTHGSGIGGEHEVQLQGRELDSRPRSVQKCNVSAGS